MLGWMAPMAATPMPDQATHQGAMINDRGGCADGGHFLSARSGTAVDMSA